jgi:hypothetical protein
MAGDGFIRTTALIECSDDDAQQSQSGRNKPASKQEAKIDQWIDGLMD